MHASSSIASEPVTVGTQLSGNNFCFALAVASVWDDRVPPDPVKAGEREPLL